MIPGINSFSACGASFLPFPAHNDSSHLLEENLSSFYPVTYELSLNAFRDIRKKHEAGKEVAEIAGVSGECVWLEQLACLARTKRSV